MEKAKVALPEIKSLAIDKLFDAADKEKTEKYRNAELPLFQYYLNLAVTNIQLLGELSDRSFKEEDVERELNKKDDNVIEKLADFLWLFKLDSPGEDFGKDYRKYTVMLAKRIIMLRNFFCHPAVGDISPLIVDMEFYRFFAGWALGEARKKSLKNGVKSDRIFKMSVMNAQTIDGDDITRNTYAFTRRGIIMLICMALYKDDATELCQAMHDMKLPKDELEMDDTLSDEEKENTKKKASVRKAYHLVMTYFSQKRSYNAVDFENRDFICFTDIVEYLNKVPSPSLYYLALNDERKMLAEKDEESTESEENRRFKYQLRERRKDRFLSFLAAYCEDFDLLPNIHFKRLDITPSIGRKRYRFGKENDNSVGQGRHYAIEKDAIRFEYRPTEHYGALHINSLRSSINATLLRHFLLASFADQLKNFKPSAVLDSYFSAYHKVLEKMLNEPECDFIDRKSYLPELRTITGASEGELMDNDSFLARMSPFFPENITRFFIPKDNIPDDSVLTERLRNALKSEIDHDTNFIDRMDRAQAWFERYKDTDREKRPKKPQEFKFNDNHFISKVFGLLNLYLPDDRKFRQLPRGKQHRGSLDFEYQTLHAVIGRFASDQQALWDYLKGEKTIYRYEGKKKYLDHTVPVIDSKCRPQLFDVADKLRELTKEFYSREKRELEKHPCIGSNGNMIRPRYSLQMLARAAIMLHCDFCKRRLEQLNAKAAELNLKEECRRFGIRLGLPLSREAIIKTILHVDEARWTNAFNYKTQKKWENRSLMDTGHVVTQIPLPNVYISNCLARKYKKDMASFFLKDGSFDFNRLSRKYFMKNAPLTLRRYYDVAPLIGLVKDGNVTGTAWEPSLLEKYPKPDEMPSKNDIDKAIRQIKDIHNQDLLLLEIVLKYHQRYAEHEQSTKKLGSISFDNKTETIYEYFSKEDTIELTDRKTGRSLRVKLCPNDRLRAVYTQIQDNIGILYCRLTEKKRSQSKLSESESRPDCSSTEEERLPPFEFSELFEELKKQQAKDRCVKIKYFSKIMKLESLVEEPDLSHLPKEEREQELFKLYLRRTEGKKKKMTLDEFRSLIEFRNNVYHKGSMFSNEECDMADKILRYFGIK